MLQSQKAIKKTRLVEYLVLHWVNCTKHASSLLVEIICSASRRIATLFKTSAQPCMLQEKTKQNKTKERKNTDQ